MRSFYVALMMGSLLWVPLEAKRALMPPFGYDFFGSLSEFKKVTEVLPYGSFSIFYPISVIGFLYSFVDVCFQRKQFDEAAEIINKKRWIKTTAVQQLKAFWKLYKVSQHGPARKAVELLVNNELLHWLYGKGGSSGRVRVNWYLALVVRYILTAPRDALVKGQGPFLEPAYEKLEMPSKGEVLELLSPDEMTRPPEDAPFFAQSLFKILEVPYAALEAPWIEKEGKEQETQKQEEKKKERELKKVKELPFDDELLFEEGVGLAENADENVEERDEGLVEKVVDE